MLVTLSGLRFYVASETASSNVLPNFDGVSVCIVARNEEQNILRCLRSLGRPQIRFEILVVDNGSTDATREIISQFTLENSEIDVRLLDSPENNMASSRTLALQNSQYQLMAFIDADCEAPFDWTDRLVAGLETARREDPRVVGIGGGQRPPENEEPFYLSLTHFLSSPLSGFSSQLKIDFSPRKVSHLATCNALFVRSELRDIVFDSEFGEVCEDVDFGWRLHKQGFRLVKVPGLDVVHFHKRRLTDWVAKIFRYSRGQLHLLERHGYHHAPELLLPLAGFLLMTALLLISPLAALTILAAYLITVLTNSWYLARGSNRVVSRRQTFALTVGSHLAALIGQSYGIFWCVGNVRKRLASRRAFAMQPPQVEL